jgi:glycosyltransferase involved in cell wall biosynthesis
LKAADYLESEQPKLPVVFEAHEIFAHSFEEGTPKYERLRSFEENVYSRARAVIATSNYLLSALEAEYPIPTKTNVIANSVERRFFEIPLHQAQEGTLIYVGSFQPWKGVDVAIATMRDLPQFTLDIFGGTPEQVLHLKGTAPENVFFHGYVSHENIRPSLAKSSLALVPNLLTPKSSLYTFPMKLLEYAAAGRLVISSDLPVVNELRLGEWARIVPANDPTALAQAVREVDRLATPELRQAAREWARNYTWDRAAEILKCFLVEL